MVTRQIVAFFFGSAVHVAAPEFASRSDDGESIFSDHPKDCYGDNIG
jgi:hypothetical protein